MSITRLKQDFFSHFARVGKALGSGNRLELLEHLAQGERSVDQLAAAAELSVANTSQHLQQLRRAGLVVNRREGLNVFYTLSGDEVIPLLSALQHVAERHIGDVEKLVNTYLVARDKLEPVPQGELLQRLRRGEVTLLDVRPAAEYRAGHLAGAINVPLADLSTVSETFNNDKDIVAYCRGPFCILAFDAVAQLRHKGFNAMRLAGGFPEWKAAGLPIEVSAT